MTASSLRLRLALAGAGAVCLALALAYFGLVLLFERHAYRTLSDDLDVFVRQIIGRLEIDGSGALTLPTPPRDPRFEAPLSGLYWQISGGTKPLRSRSLWDATLKVPADNPADGQAHRHQVLGPGGKLLLVVERRVAKGSSPTNLVVAVASDLSRLRDARDAFAADLLPSLGLLAAFLAAAMWAQLTLGLRPLARLRAEVADIAKGAARRLSDAAPVEVRPLVAEVNALLDAQDAEVERARARAADLAHGLKTPLSAIANDAARLQEEGQHEIAGSLHAASEAMRRHIERELARARLRGGRSRHGADAPLRAIAEGLVAILKRTERGETLAFAVDIPADARWPIDKNDLTEALGNLLDNATRYARSVARVSLVNPCELFVEDDGPGVDPSAEPLIRERGGRLDESGGAGLGVAIAEEILRAYAGKLEFDRSPLGGLRVKLVLPAQAS